MGVNVGVGVDVAVGENVGVGVPVGPGVAARVGLPVASLRRIFWSTQRPNACPRSGQSGQGAQFEETALETQVVTLG